VEKLKLAAVSSVRRQVYRSTGKLSPFLNKPYHTTASVSQASEPD